MSEARWEWVKVGQAIGVGDGRRRGLEDERLRYRDGMRMERWQRVEAGEAGEGSQAGYLCEVCLDAPAIEVVAAPWGGLMGRCEACGEAGGMAGTTGRAGEGGAMQDTAAGGSSCTVWGVRSVGRVRLRREADVGGGICAHAVECETGGWTLARGIEIAEVQAGVVVIVCWDCCRAAVARQAAEWEAGG